MLKKGAKMSKKLWLVVGLLVLVTGCGQEPELDVQAEQNQTEQTQVEQNQTEQTEQKEVDSGITEEKKVEDTAPIEADLSDTTSIKVTEDSLSQDNDSINENLALSLSKKVVTFDFDKYDIKSNQIEVVQEVSNILKDSSENFTVRIEGNCDEWGSDEYNYALGLKRAKVVKQALVDLGVDENKLTIISYGESNPVCSEHNKQCWARNRRDNFTLLP
jgi:peptidoglycan-associated lipoprotein